MGDGDLQTHDIQALSGADAVASLFARLGYQTSHRTEQTPANLGITSDSLQREIRRIELIANQTGFLPLQVYLVELRSVTVAATQGLARALRNRAGNYLLVLTSDYERIDFVLMERFLPRADARGEDGRGAGPKADGAGQREEAARRLSYLPLGALP